MDHVTPELVTYREQYCSSSHHIDVRYLETLCASVFCVPSYCGVVLCVCDSLGHSSEGQLHIQSRFSTCLHEGHSKLLHRETFVIRCECL